jgi:antirestriction protein
MMSENYYCPNCEYRITAECKRSAHPNQPCPNCEELWFRDFKEVPEPLNSDSKGDQLQRSSV